MRKVRCAAAGHFYDADKFGDRCPVCLSLSGKLGGETPPRPVWSILDELMQKSDLNGKKLDEVARTESLSGSVPPVSGPDLPRGGSSGEDLDATEVILPGVSTSSLPKIVVESEDGLPNDNPAEPSALDDPEGQTREERTEYGAAEFPPAEPTSARPGPLTESSQRARGLESDSAEATSIPVLSPTESYFEFEYVVPPVGWLVCIRGSYRGQAFPCAAGKNRIGRGEQLEIDLRNEPSVSRDTHAIVFYEPVRRQFYVQSGTGAGLVYLNGEMIFDGEHCPLAAYDRLTIGKLVFLFLPLCGDRFSWDMEDPLS